MFKRILLFGVVLAVLLAAAIVAVWVADLITAATLNESLTKGMTLVGVSTVAALLIFTFVKAAENKAPPSR